VAGVLMKASLSDASVHRVLRFYFGATGNSLDQVVRFMNAGFFALYRFGP
jgi:hypothetical protein